jgi:hypothetical protein
MTRTSAGFAQAPGPHGRGLPFRRSRTISPAMHPLAPPPRRPARPASRETNRRLSLAEQVEIADREMSALATRLAQRLGSRVAAAILRRAADGLAPVGGDEPDGPAPGRR